MGSEATRDVLSGPPGHVSQAHVGFVAARESSTRTLGEHIYVCVWLGAYEQRMILPVYRLRVGPLFRGQQDGEKAKDGEKKAGGTCGEGWRYEQRPVGDSAPSKG